jgi:hypothetical protein
MINDHPVHPKYGQCDEMHDGECSACIHEVRMLRQKIEELQADRDTLNEGLHKAREVFYSRTKQDGGEDLDIDMALWFDEERRSGDG